MTTKDRIRQLIDRIPEESSGRIEQYLISFLETQDPVLAALYSAPVDDEPETDEDRAAAAEGWADYEAGRVVSHEDIKRQFGG